jgi:hypothetical protein
MSFLHYYQRSGCKSRSHNADDVERLVRANLEQGVRKFFVTDDNLARNQDWEPIFDRLTAMRKNEGLQFQIIAQVDTMPQCLRAECQLSAELIDCYGLGSDQ